MSFKGFFGFHQLLKFVFFTTMLFLGSPAHSEIVIGGKKFTESYILAEIMSQYLEAHGFSVRRSFSLGGTLVAFEALKVREIDVYPEYTGTIAQVILKTSKDVSSISGINRKLKDLGVEVLSPFGFNNTYALAVNSNLAKELNLKSISDLKDHSLKFAFSYEFMKREDGWENLKKVYALNHLKGQSIEHELAYTALNAGKADLMDAYSTDAKIKQFNLVLLKDDRQFFPQYLAAPFVHKDLNPKVKALLNDLSGRINDQRMLELNAEVQINGQSFAQVAQKFLQEEGLVSVNQIAAIGRMDWRLLLRRCVQHLYLTFTAISMALVVAIPLGILLQNFKHLAEPIIAVSGLLQTIPSIALLAFMIPIFGIGVKPAIIGLFLYSILPILRNTYVALKNVEYQYLESARGIGLTGWETLFLVQLPIGFPVILAGVRTAAVINIGTATLAAFIGAGGLGEPIVTGLSLNDSSLILQGAVPAALLAIIVELIFTVWERRLQVI